MQNALPQEACAPLAKTDASAAKNTRFTISSREFVKQRIPRTNF